ncbi:MAG: oxygen-independent coproporphyrinogen III oxidase, partial [Bacteroidales bacterium]|nr:oxygen-independent coproporphyrinogen III oxidase [Bacteroidales bacterium]
DLIEQSNTSGPPNIAIYIHIPFCEKICHYCGCNSKAIGGGAMVAPYMEALKRELQMVSLRIDKNRQVSQIHYGGGTPNAIDIAYLKSINEYLFHEFRFIKKPEIAIECNPAHLKLKTIEQFIDAGFNRFSLGVQDFDAALLKKMNRKTTTKIPKLVSTLKQHGAGVNLDFIYGLPGQTVASFLRTMEQAAKIRPDRLVAFSYAHVPWLKKHQLALEKTGLVPAAVKTEMFVSACNMLSDAGYVPIGLDHFVLPSDSLSRALAQGTLHRNFQGYCTRETTGQVYAFGATAISQLAGGYSQNAKYIGAYIETVNSGALPVERGYRLSDTQIITRDAINALMCNLRLSFASIAPGKTAAETKRILNPDEAALARFAADGLLTYTGNTIEVSETGSFFIRNIVTAFDAGYAPENTIHSKTV